MTTPWARLYSPGVKVWLPRTLVLLSALLVLGTAAQALQVQHARRAADRVAAWCTLMQRRHVEAPGFWTRDVDWARCIRMEWREVPWYGRRRSAIYVWFKNGSSSSWGEGLSNDQACWHPKRSYYEILLRQTGLGLPNDPDAWEAWFRAHPDAVWDEASRRLVEAKPRAE